MSSSRKQSLVGQELGVYRIESVLGSGGMGDVYRAVHQVLGRVVAIKTLKPNIASDEGSMRRFFDEAKLVNQIRHENIVEVTDLASEPSGLSYMVMELLEGRTLTDAIRQAGQLPPERAVRIAVQMAGAMAAAHAIDVIHRDLKPDNVFLIRRAGSADYVKVLDFGIARLKRPEGDKNATQTGALIGTPAYMAPEQASGDKVSAATDIYALGTILFQMLTGRLPFEGSSIPEIMYGHLKLEPPKVSELSPDVPAPLTDVIARALRKKPEDRPESMRAIRDELLLAVGLDPSDFEMDFGGQNHNNAPSRPAGGSIPADGNAADSHADSMWSGATMDATGAQQGLGTPLQPGPAAANTAAGMGSAGPRSGVGAGAGAGPNASPGAGPTAGPTAGSPADVAANANPGGAATRSGQPEAVDAGARKPQLSAAELGSLDTVAPLSVDTGPQTPSPGRLGELPRVPAMSMPEPARPARPANYAKTRRQIALSVAAVLAVLVGAVVLIGVQRSSGQRAGEAKRSARDQAAGAPNDTPRSLPSTVPGDTTDDLLSPRERLDKACEQHHEPAAPRLCQSVDNDLLTRLADAAHDLVGGAPGGRPKDDQPEDNQPKDEQPNDDQVVRALERSSTDVAEYWYWLAKARLYAGRDTTEVVAAAEHALERCDTYAAAHGVLGTARFRAGETASAQVSYQRALALEPTFTSVRFNLGLTQLQLGQVAEGVDTFTQVLAAQPDMAEAMLVRGQAYLQLGQVALAIADLEAGTRALPDNAGGLYALGAAYLKDGRRTSDAQRTMCRAAELGHAAAADFCKR